MDSTQPSSWALPELPPPACSHLPGFDPPWKHTIPPQGAQSPGLSTEHRVYLVTTSAKALSILLNYQVEEPSSTQRLKLASLFLPSKDLRSKG